jgi:hypothetical protein
VADLVGRRRRPAIAAFHTDQERRILLLAMGNDVAAAALREVRDARREVNHAVRSLQRGQRMLVVWRVLEWP